MPRDASGNYSLPSGNPVVANTDITSSWANTTLNDIANEIQNSLSRDGEGGMKVPLKFADGSKTLPGMAFNNEPGLGLYRSATNTMTASAAGVDLYRGSITNQLEVYRNRWKTVADVTQLYNSAIVDGRFDYWLEGTTQTSSGYGSDTMWLNQHSGSSKVHSRQTFTLGQTDVPGNPKYFSRTVVTSASGVGNYVAKVFRIEDVSTFSGESVSLRFSAKADSSRNMAVSFYQHFGTVGSPSSDVTGIGAQKVALTTSWQSFDLTIDIPSVAGKTLGTNGDDYIQVVFWFDAGSNFDSRTDSLGQQSGTFDIAMVSAKSLDAEYDFRDRVVERYYEQSWDGVKSTINGAVTFRTTTTSIYLEGSTVHFYRKRDVPTMSIYSAGTGVAGYVHDTIDGDVAASASNVGVTSFGRITLGSAGTVNHIYQWHWEADARL